MHRLGSIHFLVTIFLMGQGCNQTVRNKTNTDAATTSSDKGEGESPYFEGSERVVMARLPRISGGKEWQITVRSRGENSVLANDLDSTDVVVLSSGDSYEVKVVPEQTDGEIPLQVRYSSDDDSQKPNAMTFNQGNDKFFVVTDEDDENGSSQFTIPPDGKVDNLTFVRATDTNDLKNSGYTEFKSTGEELEGVDVSCSGDKMTVKFNATTGVAFVATSNSAEVGDKCRLRSSKGSFYEAWASEGSITFDKDTHARICLIKKGGKISLGHRILASCEGVEESIHYAFTTHGNGGPDYQGNFAPQDENEFCRGAVAETVNPERRSALSALNYKIFATTGNQALHEKFAGLSGPVLNVNDEEIMQIGKFISPDGVRPTVFIFEVDGTTKSVEGWWTGAGRDGKTDSDQNCSGFTQPANGQAGVYGKNVVDSITPGANHINFFTGTCTSSRDVLCLSL